MLDKKAIGKEMMMAFMEDYHERAMGKALEAWGKLARKGDAEACRCVNTFNSFIELEMADVKLSISEWHMAMDQYWDKVRSMEARKSLFPLMKFPENMQLIERQFVEQRVEELELETELVQLMDQHEESSAGKKKRRRIRNM